MEFLFTTLNLQIIMHNYREIERYCEHNIVTVAQLCDLKRVYVGWLCSLTK